MERGAKDTTMTSAAADVRAPEPASRRTLALIGAGHMAHALARVLTRSRAELRIYARREEASRALAKQVPGLLVCTRLAEAVEGADVLFFAVPAPALLEVARAYGPHARPDQLVIHGCRGVGPGFLLPHQMIRNETCVRKIGALGGPLFAPELESGRTLAAVVASRFPEVARVLSELSHGTGVILHTSRDVLGVELAGALSNVAALASGMADGLGLGETVRGLLLAHNLTESMRLGIKLGAEPATFTGLAGVGDLIPRRVTSTDRHRQLGLKVAQGRPLEEALREAHGEVEGVRTAHEAVALGARLGLELPVAAAVDAVLAGRVEAREALEAVLRLDIAFEADGARALEAR